MAADSISRSDRKPVVTRNNDRTSETGRNKASNAADKNTQGTQNEKASSSSTASNQSYYRDSFQSSRTTTPKPNAATSKVNLKDFDYKGSLKSEPVFEGQLNGKKVKVTAPLAKTAPADDRRLDNVKYFSHETTAEGFMAQAKSEAIVAGSILRKTGVLPDSKKADDRGGGGSYVYTRVVTEKAPAVVGKGSTGSSMPVMLLMNKDLARRADMWSTSMDRYGKMPTIQQDTHGQNTDAARNTIKGMKDAAPIGNETGFYGAISYKDVEHVVVKGKDQKEAQKTFDKVVGDVFDNKLDSTLKETTGKEMEELFSYAVTGERVRDLPNRDAADRIAKIRQEKGLLPNNPSVAPEATTNNPQATENSSVPESQPGTRSVPSTLTNPQPTTPSSSKNKVGVENNGVKAQAYKGEFDVGVSVAKAETTFGDPNGPVSGSAKVEALSANASGEASAGVDLSKGTAYAKGEVEASVNVVNAEAQVKTDYGFGSTEAAAEANVGASVEAEAEVNIDPLKGTVSAEVGGEAFTGAKASGEISQTVGPVTASVGGEVMAGVGVEFEADVGLKDGKLSAKFDIGASLGIGASVEFGVEIDVGKAVETVKEVGETVVEGIKDVGETVVEGIKDVGETVVEGLKDVGEGIKDFFSGW